MKQVLLAIIVLFSLISCNKSEEILEKEIIKPAVKKIEFGFKYSDFNVIQDTIQKGDTFGTLLEEQNIGEREVYDIIAKVRDTFDVRTIRINRPFTILRSKNKKNALQVFIYQPDALNYYVVDLRDTAVVV